MNHWIVTFVLVLGASGCELDSGSQGGMAAGDTGDASTFDSQTGSEDALADTAGVDAAADTGAPADTHVADAADVATPDTGSEDARLGGVPGTGQEHCWGESAQGIPCPAAGAAFAGQDAQYRTATPTYTVHDDGTVTDEVTGLVWQADVGAKQTLSEALAGAAGFDLGGHDDWRLPTIKELYTLIDFEGTDPTNCEVVEGCGAVPYLDTDAFGFAYGDTDAGERVIDAQWVSATQYVGTTMFGDATVFGVNFADGRIKGYPIADPATGAEKRFFVRYVRGPTGYGEGARTASGGVVSDAGTGLAWTQGDSGTFGVGTDGALTWEEALAWCEGLSWGGHDDWRLPNAKELQALVDYTRSPSTTGSAAIDPIFDATPIVDEGGDTNYGFYWASTSHLANGNSGAEAVYVAFGEALGWMMAAGRGQPQLVDVHGAGAQRSDPKAGDPADYPFGHGPQGDVIRIENLARCVRGGATFDPAVGQTPLPLDVGEGGAPQGALCEGDQDCTSAATCPPDAKAGCVCTETPDGAQRCVPACTTAADCPTPPAGVALVCAQEGLCVPATGAP
ncbi:MAG: DUF1566 domain-containing protein [Deltaproteobacteria bacterium]|nr:MAG: DUF1566 domain-containing protein [Deltaproteobacteria bacterium]